jgi:hypothetical protein
MTRILYIGDPSSVHDLKWVSFFSTRREFEAFFLVQKHEMSLVTLDRKRQFDELGITVVGPIHSYSLWRVWENQASLKKIHDVIDDYNIDVIHTLFATPFALWTQNLKVPSVVTTRGSDVHVVLNGLGKGNFLHKIHGNILLNRFKSAFENAAAITCTSQGQLDRINQIFSTKLKGEIIRTGVNVEEIDQLVPSLALPDNVKDKKVVFLPRYIRPIYQTELAIDALSELPLETKKSLAIVLIRGKKTDPEYLTMIASRLKICGIDHHTYESLSQYEMWSAFKLSALTIMTPKTDGTPNSAIEAMAAKSPLILGSFNYDQDLFLEKFCHRMETNSILELTGLILNSLSDYPQQKIDDAFGNVLKFGNRPVEMGRIENLYSSLSKG